MSKLINILSNTLTLELIIVKKKGGKLLFRDLGGFQSRNNSMINLLKESLKDVDDFGYVIINTGDKPINKSFQKINILSFSTCNGYYDKVIPDFIYDCWKECNIFDFNETIKAIEKSGENEGLKKQIGRIGNFKTSPSREKLANLGKKYPDKFNIQDSSDPNTKRLSLPDLVKIYSCLIDVEGRGYSGRTKLLFFSGRPLFIQKRKWTDYCLKYAIPGKHYISIKNDFSDLKEKFEEYLNNPEIFEKIGQDGKIFAEDKLSKNSALNEIKSIIGKLKFTKFNTIFIYFFIAYRIIYKSLINFYLLIIKIGKKIMK